MANNDNNTNYDVERQSLNVINVNMEYKKDWEQTFLLISDDGEERLITCETTEQFMDVKEVVHKLLETERIEYAGLSIHEKTK